MKRFTRRTLTLVGVPVLLMSTACKEKPTPVPAASATAKALTSAKRAPRAKAPERRRPKQRPGASGAATTGLLGVALKELKLSVQQKGKLMDLRDSQRETKRTNADPRQELRGLFAQAMKTGKLDRAALAEHQRRVKTEREQERAERARVLNELHATLTPEQRGELAKIMQQREGASEKSPPTPGRQGPGANAPRKFPMLGGIELTEAQQKQLEAVEKPEASAELRRTRRDQQRARRAALFSAFAEPKFDAVALLARDDGASPDTERKVAFVEAALRVLTKEQRAQVAERLSQPERSPGKRQRNRLEPK